MAEPARCLGCGGTHFAGERLCPRTRRPVEEGAFGSLVGPYRVGKLLGAGGFGSVHVADDTRDGTSVALKLLHPELVADPAMLDRFTREAEVTIRAGNPHIVRVLEASFSGRSVYVALELLSGETLANALRGGSLEAERAVDIAIQMLDGLAVVHAAGVIHRDIKPANVFLADEPDAPGSLVKLLDFGIGRMLAADQNQRLTRTGAQLGTPHFMAPEQVADAKRADARADLYAVAVTLFAMLTGERPYGQIPVGDWLAAILRRDPANVVTSPHGPLPPALIEAVARGLSVDPDERFQDAGAFARALLDADPDSSAVTRVLPALEQTLTFIPRAAQPKTLAARRGANAQRPAQSTPAAALPALPVIPASQESPVSPAPRAPLRHRGVWIAALVSLVVVGFLAAVGIVAGLYVLDAFAEEPASAEEPPPPLSIPFGAAPAFPSATTPKAESPRSPVEGPLRADTAAPSTSGVRVDAPHPEHSAEIDLVAFDAVVARALPSFQRCRAPGRATHASLFVTVEPETGYMNGGTPTATEPHDAAASRCLWARLSEAAVGARFGHGAGGTLFLNAHFDAAPSAGMIDVPTPGAAGVSIGFRTPIGADDIEWALFDQTLNSARPAFESCRVRGLATTATVRLFLQAGRVHTGVADDEPPNDAAVGRCLWAVFSRASARDRYGLGERTSAIVVLDAALAPAP